MKFVKRGFAFFLSSCLALGIACDAFADEADQSTAAPAEAAQLAPEQLQQLVAPIALYPDALVAQILAASTHTVEIVEADRWTQAHPELRDNALAVEVDKQSWDPSVQALTEFPSVLANMDQNLAWTSSLGDAYLSQPQELMAAVQAMRQRAQQAGNLESTGQETVTAQDQAITIEPADPDVVYLPQYDPWLAYGAPVAVWPGWYPYSGLYVDGPGIAFGVGFGLWYVGGYRWGWHHWRPDWHHRTITYHHNAYAWHDRTAIDRNSFVHEHEGFDRARGFDNDHGFFGNPGSRVIATPQRGFAGPAAVPGSNFGRFGSFNHEAIGRGEMGDRRPAFGEMGREGVEIRGGGFHGGGFHGGGGHR